MYILLAAVIQQMNQLFEFNTRYSVAPLAKPIEDPIARKMKVASSPDSVLNNRTGYFSSSPWQEPIGDPMNHKTVDSSKHFLATVSNAAREQCVMEHKAVSQMSGKIAISVAEHNETLENNVWI